MHYRRAHKDIQGSNSNRITDANESKKKVFRKGRKKLGRPIKNSRASQEQNYRVQNSIFKQKEKGASYIWDQKGLGKYSAISYYKNHVNMKEEPVENVITVIQNQKNIGL